MNQLLFERATGGLGTNAFAKLETTRLLRSFRPAPQFRFDGGEKGAAVDNGEGRSNSAKPNTDSKSNIWAHQAGVNALALERFDGRMLVQLFRPMEITRILAKVSSQIALWRVRCDHQTLGRRAMRQPKQTACL